MFYAKKAVAVLLTVLLTFGCFSLGLSSLAATEYEVESAANDPSTSDIRTQFSLSETDDGKISTDKTVLYGSDSYGAFSNYAEDDFSVTLSALGQAYTTIETIETTVPSENKVHADVVFVLDVSGSMGRYSVAGGTESRAEATVTALNSAISQLMASDPETRIGIVCFGSEYYPNGVYLPIDNYTLPEGETNYITFDGKVTPVFDVVPDGNVAMKFTATSTTFAYPTKGTTSTTDVDTSVVRYRVATSGSIRVYNAGETTYTTLVSPLNDGEFVADEANGYAVYRNGSEYIIYNNIRFEDGEYTVTETVSDTVTIRSSTSSNPTTKTTVCKIGSYTYTAFYQSRTSYNRVRIYRNGTRITNITSNGSSYTDTTTGVTFTRKTNTSLSYTYTTTTTTTGKHLVTTNKFVTSQATAASKMIATSGCLINSKGEYMDVTSYTVDNDGTYTQAGLQAAEDMFLAVNDGEEAKRVPAIVLISDGVPTFATTQYDNVGTSTIGNGNVNQASNQMGYLTIRTAMCVKEAINAHYTSQKALFYSIGPGVDYLFGQTVLDPKDENLDACKGNTTTNEQSGLGTPDGLRTMLLNNLTTEELQYVDYADWSITGDMSSSDIDDAFQQIITNITDIPRPVETITTTETHPGEALNKDATMIFTDVIGDGMELNGSPVVRYAEKNYTATSSTTKTNADGSTVVSYFYNYSVQEQSTGRIGNLSDLTINVITEADGKQIVKWYIPATLLPVIYPNINTIPVSYKDASPIRLIYKVHISDSTVGGTYYTNSVDEPATVEFIPTVGNPYYYNNYEDESGEKHSVIDYSGETTAKTDNKTNTLPNSNDSSIDRTTGKVTVELGNNGVVSLRYTSVTVQKVWKDNNDSAGLRPDTVSVQLYRNGNAYGEVKTLTAADCTVTKDADNNDVWSYTFENLPFTDGDVYTAKETVVDGNYTVSENGLTITNELNVSINPDVIIIDYGKTISSSPLTNDNGDFVIDGITASAPASGVATKDSVTLTNGVATVEGDSVIYSPFKYMSSIDRVHYYVSSKTNPTKNSDSAEKMYSTVTFIPATTVYYEDNFGGSSENGGLYINYTGDWFTVSDDGTTTSGVTANTDTTDRQDNGEVGQGNTPYGNDSSYADDIKFSNGTAAQATGSVSLVNGRPQFDASASFEFTGTGFDIISRTDLDCGMITVYIVDSNGKATNVPVINKGSNTLYQIPVISYTGLSYGTYTVTINVNAPVTALGISGSVFYLDAIRIYDPMGTGSADNAEFNEANAAYNADHEANAYVASIRDYILQVGKLDETETYGAVWVDTINNDYNGGGFIEQSSIKDFELTGPNEEVYLSPGYGIGFIVESTSIPDSVQLEIKVPAPLKNGARLSVQTIGESNVTNFDVTSATEMFYDISDAVVFTPTTVNGTTLYRATVILANGLPSEDAAEIVSITNIKMTYDDAKAVVATDSVSALTLDAETVEELDETQTEAVALKASWNVYVDVFDTVYTQHQASLPEYSVSSAETEGTVKSGQTVKATVKTSRYVDALTVSDEYGSQAKITKVTSSVDESKILTEEYKTAKTWNIEFTVYGSNGTKAYTVSSANGEGETAQLDVTIENPTVESIKVYSKPNKTTYKYGESFDSTGMTLLVTYSDSTTKIIDSGYAVSPEKFTKTGTQKVTVSYGGKQTTVNVRVTYSLLQFVLKLLSFGLLWKM